MLSDTQARTQTASLAILAAVASGVAVYWLRPVLVPFVLAVFVAFALMPVVGFLQRRCRLPRPAALLAAFLLTVVAFGALGALISQSVAQMAENVDTYREQLELAWNRVQAFLDERLGVDAAAYLQSDSFRELLNTQVGRVSRGLISALNQVLSQGFLVLLFVLFLLLGSAGAPLGGLWAEVRDSSQKYILTKITTSAVTGLLTGVILSMLGVPQALVYGTLAFLLNFIPSVGSIIATLLPLPVILVDPSIGATAGILALVLPGAVQFSIGNLLEPRVMGASLDLHPVTVLLALMFWGMLWGIVGALLATPMTAVLRIVLQRIEVTRPVALLMAGHLEEVRD